MNESLDAELARYVSLLNITKEGNMSAASRNEEVKTTPLFSWPVKELVDSPLASISECSSKNAENSTEDLAEIKPAPEVLPQYALLGSWLPPTDGEESPTDLLTASDSPPKQPASPPFPIFLNTNSPWSAFICGSQGSGKSHTLSCILENCLLSAKKIGRTPQPLSGILFHYDTHSTESVCEAAYLGSHMSVKVLCSPSSLWVMKKKYEALQLPKGNIKVHPLLLRDSHLNTSRMMRLMAFSDKEGPVPLYMEVLIKILKEMAIERGGRVPFSYEEFLLRIQRESTTMSKENQKGPLGLRLQLLESFMENGAIAKKLPKAAHDIFAANPQTLTIVDLTDPFVDSASACVLFDICLSLFLEDRSGVGKVVALDEAHKFMDQSTASSIFTQKLLTVIREQRHKAARVVIATQEPTISPKLLDLCSMTFVHRFTSPEWLTALQSHLAGASLTGGQTRVGMQDMFQEIVNLNVGEALLFSPSAVLDTQDELPQKLGMQSFRFKTRPRITNDGGKSIMALKASTN